MRGHVLVVEDDLLWCELFADIIIESGAIPVWSSSGRRAVSKLSNTTDFRAVILDAGITPEDAALPLSGDSPPFTGASPLLSLLATQKFSGRIFLYSGHFSKRTMDAVVARDFPLLDVVSVAKASGHTTPVADYLAILDDDVVAHESAAGLADSTLIGVWNELIESRPERSGKCLEDAVHALLVDTGLFDHVYRNIRRSSTELDLVAIQADNRIIGNEIVLPVECKDRASPVTSSEVRAFAAKTLEMRASMGLIISRQGLTGVRRGSAASGTIRELYMLQNLSILSLSFHDCLRVATKEHVLPLLLRQKGVELRLGI